MSSYSTEEAPQPPTDGPDRPRPSSVVRAYLLLLAADFTCRALRFFADIVLVRHFSRAAIGQLNLAQSLALQGMGLSTCGLDTLGSRAVAREPDRGMQFAAMVVFWRLILGVAAWGGIAAIAWFVPRYHPVFRLTVLYGLSILTGAATLGWVAQALRRIPIVALAMLATNIGYFLGVELIIQLGGRMAYIPVLLAVVEGTAAIFLLAWLRRVYGRISWKLNRDESKQFFLDALPVGLANYLRTLTIGSDVLLLGLFVGEVQVGLYGTGFKLFSVGMSLIAMYLGILLPQLAAADVTRHQSKVRDSLKRALSASFWKSVPLVLLATIVAVVAADFAVTLLFGAAFHAAAPALRILFLSWPLQLVSGHFRTVLLVQGNQRQDLAIVGGAAAVHIIAKGILIPYWGLVGAAYGTVIGEAVLAVLSWRVMRRTGLQMSSTS